MEIHPGQVVQELVLLRHGESVWNEENRFCGWTDVDWSDWGKDEGRNVGHELKEHGISFDVAFPSALTRAIRTLWITLNEMGLLWIPVHRYWRLIARSVFRELGLSPTSEDKTKNHSSNDMEQPHSFSERSPPPRKAHQPP